MSAPDVNFARKSASLHVILKRLLKFEELFFLMTTVPKAVTKRCSVKLEWLPLILNYLKN